MPDPIRHVFLTPADFMADVDYAHWEARLCGAYCNLIFCMYANNGRVPRDPEVLQKLAHWHGEGWTEAWQKLSGKFQTRGAFIRHKRVTKELRRARKAWQAKHDRAVKGGKARWAGQSLSTAQAELEQSEGKEGKVRESKEGNTPPISPSKLEDRIGGAGSPPLDRRDPITVSRLRAWNTKCLEDLKANGRSGILALSDKHLWELMKQAGGVEAVEKLSSHLYWRSWRGFIHRKSEEKKYPWHPMWILRRISENGAADEKQRAREQAGQVRRKLEADNQQAEQTKQHEQEEALQKFRKLPKETREPWILKAGSGPFAPRKPELIERMAAMLWQKGK